MSVRFTSLLVAAGVVLFQGLAADEEAAAEVPPRTDPQGDPLPEGAVARLGVDRLCQPPVHQLMFSPDDKMLAAVDETGIRLWDVQSGKQIRRFLLQPFGVYRTDVPGAFSPDGKLVALIDQDHVVHGWDVAGGEERFQFGGDSDSDHPVYTSVLAFDPRGRDLAAAGPGTILLWDLKRGKAVKSISNVVLIADLAFSADGATLSAAATPDPKSNDLFDLNFSTPGGDPVRRQPLGVDIRAAGALAPDGTVFAAKTRDGNGLRLLDAITGKERCRTEGTADQPDQVAFSSDGRFLAASSCDGVARVWDASNGKRVQEIKASSAWVERVALSHDGKLLALAGTADAAVHLWDLSEDRGPKERHVYPGHRAGPLTVAFSEDGKKVITTNRERAHVLPGRVGAEWSLREWDPETGRELGSVQRQLGGEVYATAFSEDRGLLAVLVQDGTFRLWDVRQRKEVRKWSGPTQLLGKADSTELRQAAVVGPTFSADGKTLLAAEGPQVHRWRVETGEELAPLKTPNGLESSLALPTPAGDGLLIGEWADKSACVLTLVDAAAKPVRVLWRGPKPGDLPPERQWPARFDGTLIPRAWSFSPDGKTLAVSEKSAVTLWEVVSGRNRGRLEHHLEKAEELAFSPDGRFLAVGGYGRVELWDLARNVEVKRLDGFDGLADSLAFSPDQRRFAVGGWFNTVLIYDMGALVGQAAATGKPTDEEKQGLWQDLTGRDGARAYRATLRWMASPDAATGFLAARIKPPADPDGAKIARLIADLDNDSFDVRENAGKELIQFGEKAETALGRILEGGTPSPEVRSRAEKLLGQLNPMGLPAPPSSELIALRVLEILANCRTPEAEKAIQELAAGPADLPLTRQAKAALSGRRNAPPVRLERPLAPRKSLRRSGPTIRRQFVAAG